MAKGTYVVARKVKTVKLSSGDQILTVEASEGKKGFNVKASVKDGKGKGAPKAVTGCREQFVTELEAMNAVDKLKDEAMKRGWSENVVSAKNAFTSIPAPKAKAKK